MIIVFQKWDVALYLSCLFYVCFIFPSHLRVDSVSTQAKYVSLHFCVLAFAVFCIAENGVMCPEVKLRHRF